MIKCAIVLFFTCFISLSLGLAPVFADGCHCENTETSDAEIKLELEEEDFLATNLHLELGHFTLLFTVGEFSEPHNTEYVVYLSRKVRPPRS